MANTWPAIIDWINVRPRKCVGTFLVDIREALP